MLIIHTIPYALCLNVTIVTLCFYHIYIYIYYCTIVAPKLNEMFILQMNHKISELYARFSNVFTVRMLFAH